MKNPKITHEIRYDADNFVDEIIIMIGDKCVVHLEHMGTGSKKGKENIWMGLYADTVEMHVNFFDVRGMQVYDSDHLQEDMLFPEIFQTYKDRKYMKSYGDSHKIWWKPWTWLDKR